MEAESKPNHEEKKDKNNCINTINAINANNSKLFKSNPAKIEFLNDIIEDSYSDYTLDNTFCIFQSINKIFYLIYANEKNSIISYDIAHNKKICELIKAHENYITNFRHHLDIINERDLLISISADDNNIKLWDVRNFECLLNLPNINRKGCLYSACFLNYNNDIFILSSNSTFKSEPIKVYDLKGNKVKMIKTNRDSIYFIDTYYDKKSNKIYIITGNQGHASSYDFIKNDFYKIYLDNNNECHDSLIIYDTNDTNDSNDIVKLIESSKDGYIRIFNFNTGIIIHKFKASNLYLVSICLWNDHYLFAASGDKSIKLIDLNDGKVIKRFFEHKNSVITIKKFIHPIYGECLISQNKEKSEIKLWIINNN